MKSELYNLIAKYEKIIIHRHLSPDGDALGSQFALRELIKFNFPTKEVFAAGEENAISDFLKGLFPPSDLLTTDDYQGSLVIVVDTANKERIAGPNWKLGDYIISIDHHENSENFGDKLYNFSNYSSCCEVLSEFIFATSKLKINQEIAKYLYLGIITDTGRFSYQGLSYKSFEQAANLIKNYNLNKEINEQLSGRKTAIIRFQGYVMQNYQIDQQVAYIFLPKNIEQKFNLNYSEVSSQINLLLWDNSIKYVFYTSWDELNESYKFSIRSKDQPINQIAEKFNGGGHKMASGGRVKNHEDLHLILDILKDL